MGQTQSPVTSPANAAAIRRIAQSESNNNNESNAAAPTEIIGSEYGNVAATATESGTNSLASSAVNANTSSSTASQSTSAAVSGSATAVGVDVSSSSSSSLASGCTFPERRLLFFERSSRGQKYKRILFFLLFSAMDGDGNGFLDRAEILHWLSEEPYLNRRENKFLIGKLNEAIDHDEDSRCSLNEFTAAFQEFHFAEIVKLIINLIRAEPMGKRDFPNIGMEFADSAVNSPINRPSDATAVTSPIQSPTTLFSQLGQAAAAALSSPLIPIPIRTSSGSGASASTSSSSSASTSFLSSFHRLFPFRSVASIPRLCSFLLDLVYQSLDVDLDGLLDEFELANWLAEDEYFLSKPDLMMSIGRLLELLKEDRRKQIAAALAGSATAQRSLAPEGQISKKDFLVVFSSLSLDVVLDLFLHLLQRTTRHTLREKQKLLAALQAAEAEEDQTAYSVLRAFEKKEVEKKEDKKEEKDKDKDKDKGKGDRQLHVEEAKKKDSVRLKSFSHATLPLPRQRDSLLIVPSDLPLTSSVTRSNISLVSPHGVSPSASSLPSWNAMATARRARSRLLAVPSASPRSLPPTPGALRRSATDSSPSGYDEWVRIDIRAASEAAEQQRRNSVTKESILKTLPANLAKNARMTVRADQVVSTTIPVQFVMEGASQSDEKEKDKDVAKDEDRKDVSSSVPSPSSSSVWSTLSFSHSCDLSVVLTGQSMIQHDLRQLPFSAQRMDAISEYLQGDVVWTELETALWLPGMDEHHQQPQQPQQQQQGPSDSADPPTKDTQSGAAARKAVFFHAAPPSVLDCLSDLNFRLLSASNNHSGDLGVAGIGVLMDEFQKRGFSYSGIGSNLQAAASACVYRTKPHERCPYAYKVAHVSFASKVPVGTDACDTPPRAGVNTLSILNVDADVKEVREDDARRVLSVIHSARVANDVVIAYHHNHVWENAAVNVAGKMGTWRAEWARRCIDAGASLYVAHGEPRLQGIEIYRGYPIFYCLGSFIFQTKTALQFYSFEVWQSLIVRIHYHANPFYPPHREHLAQHVDAAGRHVINVRDDVAPRGSDEHETTLPFVSFSIQLIPLVLNESGENEENHLKTRGLPQVATGEEAKDILRRVAEMSKQWGTVVDVEENRNSGEVIGWVRCEANGNGNGKEAHAQIQKAKLLTFEGDQRTNSDKQHEKQLSATEVAHGDAAEYIATAAVPTLEGRS